MPSYGSAYAVRRTGAACMCQIEEGPYIYRSDPPAQARARALQCIKACQCSAHVTCGSTTEQRASPHPPTLLSLLCFALQSPYSQPSYQQDLSSQLNIPGYRGGAAQAGRRAISQPSPSSYGAGAAGGYGAVGASSFGAPGAGYGGMGGGGYSSQYASPASGGYSASPSPYGGMGGGMSSGYGMSSAYGGASAAASPYGGGGGGYGGGGAYGGGGGAYGGMSSFASPSGGYGAGGGYGGAAAGYGGGAAGYGGGAGGYGGAMSPKGGYGGGNIYNGGTPSPVAEFHVQKGEQLCKDQAFTAQYQWWGGHGLG